MNINLNADEWSIIERCDQRFILFYFDTRLLCNFNKRKLNWFSITDISGRSKQNNCYFLYAWMAQLLWKPLTFNSQEPDTITAIQKS